MIHFLNKLLRAFQFILTHCFSHVLMETSFLPHGTVKRSNCWASGLALHEGCSTELYAMMTSTVPSIVMGPHPLPKQGCVLL